MENIIQDHIKNPTDEVYLAHQEFMKALGKFIRSLPLENGFYHFSVDILQTKKEKHLHFYKENLKTTTEKEIWK